MLFENLLLDRDGAVVTVTINRPKSLNALNRQTLRELGEALAQLQDDPIVRCLIITGAGDRAFIAGADINELAVLTPLNARELALSGQHLFSVIETLGKPVVAAINGVALGGGCELAMACTLRIASDTARLGQPEINLGLIPGYAGTQRMARLVGKGKAMELILTGIHITADEAVRIGLVNRVVPAGELMTHVRALAAELAAKPPVAVRCCIDAINQGLDMPFAEGCQHEATLFGLVTSTEDMREGTKAFLEKRKAEFKGK